VAQEQSTMSRFSVAHSIHQSPSPLIQSFPIVGGLCDLMVCADYGSGVNQFTFPGELLIKLNGHSPVSTSYDAVVFRGEMNKDGSSVRLFFRFV
jgi:hypothetical protein